MQPWHLTYASEGRHPLFRDEAARRRAIRMLARVGGGRMALFSLVDDHLHTVPVATRDDAGRLKQSLWSATTAIAPGRVAVGDLRPVEDRAHLQRLVRYALTQVVRHGLDAHPALWTGSCFLDLAGARYVEGLTLRLAESLPRMRLRQMMEMVGLEPQPIEPISNDVLQTLGARRIADAAGAAVAARPDLRGNGHAELLARRAAIDLAREVNLSVTDVARALGVCERTVCRHSAGPVSAPVLRAARVRLALEERVTRDLAHRGVGAVRGQLMGTG